MQAFKQLHTGSLKESWHAHVLVKLVQFLANLPSDRLWLRVSYRPGWKVISPPPPLGDQEGCSMEGKGQPLPPAA